MMVQNPDIVIVGAGAAGIGAGLALTRLGISHVILEAKHRVGGRAYSETSSLGHLWDQGCHWLHSADKNVLRFIAEKIGHQFPAKQWMGELQTFLNGQWTKSTIREDYVWTLIEKIIATGRAGEDIAAATLLNRSDPWYPMVRHWCQLLYSMDPEELSTGDAGNYSDSGINLPVQAGYGALVEKLSRHLPIRLNAKVISIAVTPKSVRVETSSGIIEAKACIVAVPARVLETEKISFTPVLPQYLKQAFQDVPLGWYEKVAFAFDGPVFSGFEVPFVDVFDPVAADTKPLNFELHPFGRPIAVTHFGGSVAKDMAVQGEAAMKEFAFETLVKAFGSDIQKRVVASATSQWTTDPAIGGGRQRRGRCFQNRSMSGCFWLANMYTSTLWQPVMGPTRRDWTLPIGPPWQRDFPPGQKTPCGFPAKLVDFRLQASYIGTQDVQPTTHGASIDAVE